MVTGAAGQSEPGADTPAAPEAPDSPPTEDKPSEGSPEGEGDSDSASSEEITDEEIEDLPEDEISAEEEPTEEPEPAEEEPTESVEEEFEEFDPASDPAVKAGEADVFIPGEEPNRPAPPGKGVVWGQLHEGTTGQGALEAQVKVKGTSIEVFTDLDGYYRLELPPGSYTLELFYPLYEPEELSSIVVKAGKVQRVDADLTPQEGAIDEVIIEDKAETQTVEGLALVRQRSISQGDAIGREEISKGTDGNAAEAAQRVVGANIVGGRFVYVRGLGERYSNSLLGGYPLPSPEPDRAAVPLDVFPASVLDSLTIVKTATPDMPADFAGGSVQIETRSVPSEPFFNIGISGGYNTQSTFRKRMDYSGSRTDWLGFDNGKRKLASSVPTDRPVAVTGSDPLTPEEVSEVSRDLNTPMHAGMVSTPVDHGLSVVGGSSWKTGEKSRVGVLGSFNYSHKYEIIKDEITREFRPNSSDPRGYDALTDFKVDTGAEKIRWGAFGKVSFLSGLDHNVTLSTLHSQLADDYTKLYNGYRADTQRTYSATQLDWLERGLTFGLLSGRHRFLDLNRAELGWDLSLARAFRSEPDRRDTVYFYSDRLPTAEGRGSGWQYQNSDDSGRHFYADQTENSFGGKLDFRQPLLAENKPMQLAVKAGALANLKARDFSVRRFQMQPIGTPQQVGDPRHCIGETYELDCPATLFDNQNIPDVLSVVERPQSGDAYLGKLNVYAGYAMLDWEPFKVLRVASGARVEHTYQIIEPRSSTGGTTSVEGAQLEQTDALPSVAVIVSATEKSKVRTSYAKTLARPTVREIAPFAFASYFGGRQVTGNPNLEITKIDNVDLRYEFWPTLTEVLAGSVFYKHLDKPIEQILIPAGDSSTVVQYENADSANVVGMELEARKSLSTFTPMLTNFSLISNLTLTHSKTQVRQAGNNTVTNPTRPLINQAPWVVNVALDYSNPVSGTNARITYNVNGRTLVVAGTLGIDDGYLQPRHSLDIGVSQKFLESWSAKLQLENLLNDDYLVTVGPDGGGDTWNQYRTGAVLSLGLSYEH